MKQNKKPRPQNMKATIKRLLGYMIKSYKSQLILVAICIVISSVVGVIGSLFLQILIDDYITPLLLATNPSFGPLFNVIVMMGGVYLLGVVASYLFNIIMSVVAQGVLKDIRDDLFSHMQKLPLRYFDSRTHGEIMSHYTNDVDTLRQMIAMSLPQMLSSVITIVAVIWAMLTTNLHLSAIVAVLTVLMLNITKFIVKKSGGYFVKQQASIAKANGYIEEMISGQKVIKVFNREKNAKDDFDKLNDELCHNATQANRFSNILMPIMNNLGNLQYVLLAVVGGAFAINGVGGITLGIIATFLQLSRTFIMPIGQVSQQLNSVAMALAGAERIFGLMDQSEEVDDGVVTLVNIVENEGKIEETKKRGTKWAWKKINDDNSVSYVELKGDVRFEKVDFGYNEEKRVLKEVSLYAKPGQKVAFVGATGAGKTTITNLINRFYDIDSGKITYDGIDVKDIKKDDLRRSLGIVLQDTNLFTGTVMENIRYGNLEASDDECIEAAKKANADAFISMLPEGYQTVIAGDGGDLSQGQRQLLSIARAAVANPPVMILDEATSSIDTRTETIIQQGMDSLMQGRTVFVIAHRLSTVKNSDVIIVLDQGEIIEKGSHEDLLKEKGKYYQLYQGAFELE